MSQVWTKNRESYFRKMAIDGIVVNLEIPEMKELLSLMRYTTNNFNSADPPCAILRQFSFMSRFFHTLRLGERWGGLLIVHGHQQHFLLRLFQEGKFICRVYCDFLFIHHIQ